MRCRPLATLDAPAAVAVIHAAFTGMAVDPPSGALGETAASIAAHLAVMGGVGCATPAGLAGVVLWTARDDALYLSRLAVAPAYRRQGVATRLIAAVEDAARQRGRARLLLGVRIELASNHRLFAACGFGEIGRTCHPGYDRPTSIDMEKRLG